MKEEKFQVRCSLELKKKAKAYAKRNDTTMSRVTVEMWKNILKIKK